MLSIHRLHCSHLGGQLVAGLCLLFGTPAFGQTDGAIVTNHGATVRGLVQGCVLGLDPAATVAVENNASVIGDLVLPAGKTPANGTELKLSPGARVTGSDETRVKGRQRVAKSFALPKAASHKRAAGDQSVVMEKGSEPDPDFKRLRDLTLRNASRGPVLPARTLALPPGSYGTIVVEEGQLLLGTAGSTERVRYTFEHLAVGTKASIELLSPVILSVGQVEKMDGRIGSKRYTQWLDLRVASGDLSFGPGSEIHGVVLAEASGVTLGRGAKLRGGVICDRATVESEACFTGVQPSWSPEASGNALPMFVHKAMRVEQRLGELVSHCENLYRVAISYPDDSPFLELKAISSRITSAQEQQAFFEACCTLFDATGFASGRIMIDRHGSAPSLEGNLTARRFEDAVRVLGSTGSLRDDMRLVRADPARLATFMESMLSPAPVQ